MTMMPPREYVATLFPSAALTAQSPQKVPEEGRHTHRRSVGSKSN